MSAVYLAAADQLLRTVVPGAQGTWPRACAWLLRLELESALDGFWGRVRPEIGAVQAQRPKQLMLSAYTGPDLARRVSYVWWALSRAGHHHHYELGVTAAELLRLRDELVLILHLLRNARADA
ncbi:MAG: hypothetical protein ABW000_04185 [Actinoplanes sp.]